MAGRHLDIDCSACAEIPNVKTQSASRPDIVQHDMKAEIGACRVGERRVLSLLQKYGRVIEN